MELERIVLSNKEWISVKIPKGLEAESWYYAVVWANLTGNGYPPEKALQIAEAAAFKRMYPGIVFIKSLEDEIKKLYA